MSISSYDYTGLVGYLYCGPPSPFWHLHQTERDWLSMPYVDLAPCMSAAVSGRARIDSVMDAPKLLSLHDEDFAA